MGVEQRSISGIIYTFIVGMMWILSVDVLKAIDHARKSDAGNNPPDPGRLFYHLFKKKDSL